MAENPMPFAAAEDYLLGRLSPAAQREFGARLAQEPALRRQVRELEEGLVALALTAPQLRPPAGAWSRIQDAFAHKPQICLLAPVFLLRWLLRGWPVAGGLAVGLLVHLAFVHSYSLRRDAGVRAGESTSLPGSALVTPAAEAPEPRHQLWSPAPALPWAGSVAAFSPVSAGEGDSLLPEIELPPRPERVGPASREEDGHGRCRPGPRKHGDISAALASLNCSSNSMPPSSVLGDAGTAAPVAVDLVQLSDPRADASSSLAVIATTNEPVMMSTGLELWASASTECVSMVVANDDLMIMVDPATLPANTGILTVWVADSEGDQLCLGTVQPGGEPIVIEIANADLSGSSEYFITGGSSILGSFP
jgi:hypothetical protein